MKLFLRNGYYYIRFSRDERKSTGTKNKAEALRILNALKNKERQEIFGKKKYGITLSQAKDMYISLREQHRDLSPLTIEKDISALKVFAKSIGDEIFLNEITDDIIERFKIASIERGVKQVSINSYLRHIKAFLNYFKDKGYIEKPPIIKMLKLGKRLPHVLSKKEIDAISTYTLQYDAEMYKIITFALYTGCRRDEIAKADYKDINDQGFIIVHGKGNKQRSVFLLQAVLDVLERPLPYSGKIFAYGKTHISHKFKKITRACGIEDLHFHLLRHTAATNMIINGISLEVVQMILGHSDISTTKVYTHIANDFLAQQMTKLKY